MEEKKPLPQTQKETIAEFRKKEAERNAKVNPQGVPMWRVRYLMVNPVDFLKLLTVGMTFAKRAEIIEGVPADAFVRNITVDHVRGGIIFVVESKEYEEVPRTDMPPVQLVSIKQGVEGATKPKKKKRK